MDIGYPSLVLYSENIVEIKFIHKEEAVGKTLMRRMFEN